MYLTDLNGDMANLKSDGKAIGQNVLTRIEKLFRGSTDQIPKRKGPTPDPCVLVSSGEIAEAFGLGETLLESSVFETLRGDTGAFGCEWTADQGTELNNVVIEVDKVRQACSQRREA